MIDIRRFVLAQFEKVFVDVMRPPSRVAHRCRRPGPPAAPVIASIPNPREGSPHHARIRFRPGRRLARGSTARIAVGVTAVVTAALGLVGSTPSPAPRRRRPDRRPPTSPPSPPTTPPRDSSTTGCSAAPPGLAAPACSRSRAPARSCARTGPTRRPPACRSRPACPRSPPPRRPPRRLRGLRGRRHQRPARRGALHPRLDQPVHRSTWRRSAPSPRASTRSSTRAPRRPAASGTCAT